MPSVDAGVVLAIRAALERTGRPGAGQVEDSLVRHHGVDRRDIELTDRVYAWGLPEDRTSKAGVGGPRTFHRSFWPSTHFCVIAGGSRDVALELAARLPRVGGPRDDSLLVSVNGERLGVVPLTDRWTRHRLRLDRGHLRRGINRLTLAWPVLPPEGDAAIASLRERLDLGLPAELHPIFGELSSLRARPLGS